MSLQDTFNDVRAWARERGLTDVHKQLWKHCEEIGEIGGALCRDDRALLIDSIGDAGITTINTMQAGGGDLDYELQSMTLSEATLGEVLDLACDDLWGHEARKDPFAAILIAQANMHLAIVRGRTGDFQVAGARTIVALHWLAQQHGLTFTDCLSAAWNEIRDRKGQTKDGVFVKAEDLVPA